MAYTAIVTKQEVVERPGINDFTVTIHVLIKDAGDVTMMEGDYSQRYNSDVSIGEIKNEFQSMIQQDWDQYLSEKYIYDAAAFDTMVSQIQTTANTYINS